MRYYKYSKKAIKEIEKLVESKRQELLSYLSIGKPNIRIKRIKDTDIDIKIVFDFYFNASEYLITYKIVKDRPPKTGIQEFKDFLKTITEIYTVTILKQFCKMGFKWTKEIFVKCDKTSRILMPQDKFDFQLDFCNKRCEYNPDECKNSKYLKTYFTYVLWRNK